MQSDEELRLAGREAPNGMGIPDLFKERFSHVSSVLAVSNQASGAERRLWDGMVEIGRLRGLPISQ